MPLVKVVSQDQIGENMYELTFRAPYRLQDKGYSPGQFLHIRVSDSYDFVLRRPLSLCKADVINNEITVVYRAQGEGTRRIAQKTKGDLIDVLGPLGKGFPMHKEDKKVILIGGGIGVPPLLELARQLKEANIQIEAVLGFQNIQQVILLDDFSQYSNVHVVTDDGSFGEKGRVTDLFSDEILKDANRYYSCGPTPMLNAVQLKMQEFGIAGYLSLEERMGCGFGLCAGCVHKIVRSGETRYLKTCREGPVFAAQEVVFS